MTPPVIQTQGLTKTYQTGRRRVDALRDLTLAVNPGEIFGYLGPNGAGKTTTIRLLLDFIRPTSGSAHLFGQPVARDSVALRRRVGYLPAELTVWRGYTARQAIGYAARLRGLRDTRHAEQLAERLKLDTTRPVRDFSTGNKRKLGLVLALMHHPELLILDEPTSGLDPLMQQTFNQMMTEVRAQGRTVFLSSHLLGEVQAICDRVAIVRDGQLQAVERVADLTHVRFRNVTLRFREAVPREWVPALAALPGTSDVQADAHTLTLRLHGDFDPVLRAVGGGYLTDVTVHEPTLEEVFLSYYGTPTAANGQEA